MNAVTVLARGLSTFSSGFRGMAACAFVATVVFSPSATANSQDVIATTVPASACQPYTSAHAAKVFLSNSGWAFLDQAVGEVLLYCPVSFHGPAHSGNSPNERLLQDPLP